VISIIALLLAILLPSLNKAREQGRKIVCGSNLHQSGLALTLYSIDNNDRLPPFYGVNASIGPVSSIGFDMYNPAVGGQFLGLLIPPLGNRLSGGWAQGIAYLENADVAFCPGDKTKIRANSGFGKFINAAPTVPEYRYISYWSIYITDPFISYYGVKEYPSLYSARHKLTVQGNPVIMMDQGGAYPLYPFYHKSGSNTLHLDGHVNFVAAEKITQFPSSTTPECIEFLDNQ